VALDALVAAGDDIEAWNELVAASLRVGAYEYAQRGLTEAEHWINLTYQAKLDTPAARRDQAMLAHLKARYAVRQADFAAAVAWYEFASTQWTPSGLITRSFCTATCSPTVHLPKQKA
jgi:MoxR-like ATPase